MKKSPTPTSSPLAQAMVESAGHLKVRRTSIAEDYVNNNRPKMRSTVNGCHLLHTAQTAHNFNIEKIMMSNLDIQVIHDLSSDFEKARTRKDRMAVIQHLAKKKQRLNHTRPRTNHILHRHIRNQPG